jgi:hypothetical protein
VEVDVLRVGQDLRLDLDRFHTQARRVPAQDRPRQRQLLQGGPLLVRQPDRSRRERSRPTSCRNRYRAEGVLRGAKGQGQGDGVLNATLTDELWAALAQRIDAHSMTNYRNLTDALSPKEPAEGTAEKV